MIRCMAIDDEPLALQQITAYISKVPFLELVAQCQSALEAHQFLQNDTVDVIFCDINMPDLNGMDFIKTLTAPPLGPSPLPRWWSSLQPMPNMLLKALRSMLSIICSNLSVCKTSCVLPTG